MNRVERDRDLGLGTGGQGLRTEDEEPGTNRQSAIDAQRRPE